MIKQAVLKQIWIQADRKRVGQSVDQDALGVALSIVNLHEANWRDEGQTMCSGESVEMCVFTCYSMELMISNDCDPVSPLLRLYGVDSRTKGILWNKTSSCIKVLHLADLVLIIEFLIIKS